MAETIPIDRISTDGTHTRAELNQTVIDEYAEAYEQGIDLPPIDVYFDEETYWLADGFHHLRAVQQIGRDSIVANVHPGGQRDALLSALGANETHGGVPVVLEQKTTIFWKPLYLLVSIQRVHYVLSVGSTHVEGVDGNPF